MSHDRWSSLCSVCRLREEQWSMTYVSSPTGLEGDRRMEWIVSTEQGEVSNTLESDLVQWCLTLRETIFIKGLDRTDSWDVSSQQDTCSCTLVRELEISSSVWSEVNRHIRCGDEPMWRFNHINLDPSDDQCLLDIFPPSPGNGDTLLRFADLRIYPKGDVHDGGYNNTPRFRNGEAPSSQPERWFHQAWLNTADTNGSEVHRVGFKHCWYFAVRDVYLNWKEQFFSVVSPMFDRSFDPSVSSQVRQDIVHSLMVVALYSSSRYLDVCHSFPVESRAPLGRLIEVDWLPCPHSVIIVKRGTLRCDRLFQNTWIADIILPDLLAEWDVDDVFYVAIPFRVAPHESERESADIGVNSTPYTFLRVHTPLQESSKAFVTIVQSNGLSAGLNLYIAALSVAPSGMLHEQRFYSLAQHGLFLNTDGSGTVNCVAPFLRYDISSPRRPSWRSGFYPGNRRRLRRYYGPPIGSFGHTGVVEGSLFYWVRDYWSLTLADLGLQWTGTQLSEGFLNGDALDGGQGFLDFYQEVTSPATYVSGFSSSEDGGPSDLASTPSEACFDLDE